MSLFAGLAVGFSVVGALAVLFGRKAAAAGPSSTDSDPEQSEQPPSSIAAPTDVAQVARGEVERWKGLDEKSADAEPMLREYWQTTGQPYPGPETAWSAAFISWVVKHSNIPAALSPSGAHVYYARRAYLDRGKPGRYGAFRPDEVTAIAPGDIVVSRRQGSDEELAFDDLTHSGAFIPAHGDVVVDAHGDALRLVGGNVNDTVSERSASAKSPNIVAVLRFQPA